MPRCSKCNRVYEAITDDSKNSLWGCIQCGKTKRVTAEEFPDWETDRKVLSMFDVPLLTVHDIPLNQ